MELLEALCRIVKIDIADVMQKEKDWFYVVTSRLKKGGGTLR